MFDRTVVNLVLDPKIKMKVIINSIFLLSLLHGNGLHCIVLCCITYEWFILIKFILGKMEGELLV